MPAKSHSGNRQIEHNTQSVVQSAIYSPPWWRGSGNGFSFGESASKSSSVEDMNGSHTDGNALSHADSGLDDGSNSSKARQIAVESRSDGDNGQETHLKQIPSSAPATLGGQLELNSQMELVGHSIVLTSYPYSDPQYGGMLTSYPTQAMVPPHLYGMHHARMLLPLEMEEEPVYVNAKQFHGILRRRQARAKAELEKKAIKSRKPYLHESRHKHAMRRARGCGGRFLSSKKTANDSTIRGKDGISNDSDSSGPHDLIGINSNGNRQSSMCHSLSGDGLSRGIFAQQRESAHTVSNGRPVH